MRKPTTRTLIVLAAAVFALGCGAAGKTSPIGDQAPLGSTAPAPPQKASYHKPTTADFTLTVKILEQSCFGSAGCNITYRIDVAYGGPLPLDPAITYEVTYEVKGGEDPKIGTLKVTGDQVLRDERDLIQTSSSKDKLTAVVTSVDG